MHLYTNEYIIVFVAQLIVGFNSVHDYSEWFENTWYILITFLYHFQSSKVKLYDLTSGLLISNYWLSPITIDDTFKVKYRF